MPRISTVVPVKGTPSFQRSLVDRALALPATRSASSFQTSRSLAISIRSQHRAPTIYRRFQEHETLSAKKGKWSVIVSASNSFVMRWLGSNSCYRIRLYTPPGIIHPNNRITMMIQWHAVAMFHLNCSPRISSKLLNTSTNVWNGNETLLTIRILGFYSLDIKWNYYRRYRIDFENVNSDALPVLRRLAQDSLAFQSCCSCYMTSYNFNDITYATLVTLGSISTRYHVRIDFRITFEESLLSRYRY